MSHRDFTTFAEFWPHYVREHGHRVNRALHAFGTTLGLAIFAGALVTATWWLLVLVPVAGYGFAWIGHFGVQKNVPATFQYPLWSLRGDFKMLGMMARGRMREEVRRAYEGFTPGRR